MIEQLVKSLPEVYQPIFGYKELSNESSRLCIDRLKEIEQIYSNLEQILGRPLNVLDLGCAQGFFSFNLAQRGAVVHGVDYLDKNIALCKALALENPTLQVKFTEGKIEEIIGTINQGQYDLVLGLSVFHHLVYSNGISTVKTLLNQLAQLSGALVLEIALQSEPLYWGPSQPDDPRELIHDIGFVHLVTHHSTHLAAIERPLFIASNYFCILNDFVCKYDYWSNEPYDGANGVHQFGRRYFFSKDHVIKIYRIDSDKWHYNKQDFKNEVKFLKYPPEGISVPQVFTYGEHSTECWLAMQRLPGCLLLDLINEGAVFDSRNVILSILQQLVALEASGLYHNDVRAWNVLVDKINNSACLIDYGSISTCSSDCVWPHNIFLSFFVFVKEIATSKIGMSDPFRTVAISPCSLPEPYHAWALSLWGRAINEWSFKYMYEMLLKNGQNSASVQLDEQPINIWMHAIEKAIELQKLHVNHLIEHTQSIAYQSKVKAEQAEAKAQQAEAKAEQAEAEAKAQQAEAKAQQAETKAELAEAKAELAEVKALQAEVKAQQAEAKAELAEVNAQQAEFKAQQIEHQVYQFQNIAEQLHMQLQAVHASRSWRVTRPLRVIKRLLTGDMALIERLTKAIKLRIKILLRPILVKIIHYINERPSMSYRLKNFMLRFPRLRQRLIHMVINAQFSHTVVNKAVVSTDQSNMSQYARLIYSDLQRAIELSNKGGCQCE